MSKKLQVKVSADFLNYTPVQKVDFGKQIIADMTANVAIFPTPDVAIAVLQTVTTDLENKNVDAASGDHVKVLERAAAEKVWDTTFKNEAAYVQHRAAGDKVMIAQSGFHSTQEETHIPQKPAQAVLTAYGNRTSGSIHAEIAALADSKGTLFIAAQPGNAIQSASITGKQIKLILNNGAQLVLGITTTRDFDFEGLIGVSSYTIAALAFNAQGLGDVANPIEVTAP